LEKASRIRPTYIQWGFRRRHEAAIRNLNAVDVHFTNELGIPNFIPVQRCERVPLVEETQLDLVIDVTVY
jgi:hypothetical protein